MNENQFPPVSEVPDNQPQQPATNDDLLTMTFRQACDAFLESRKPFLHPRTYRDYEYCKKWLIGFFGTKRLPDITAEHIRKYQRVRSERCGPHMINHECGILVQMLKRIGRWEYVGLGYQPLPLPREKPGRAISDDEERRLLRAGASNPRWETAYFFTLISLHTTMGPGEVMTLRRKDIDLDKKSITVNAEGAKNANRMRLIPLNDISLRVCQEALSVAEKRGSNLPDHYVFPFRKYGSARAAHYDPTRHCTTFKTAWTEMLKVAGIPKLRPYDLRHTSITRLCENPTNAEEVIESIAGHITHQMKKRYSHVRVEARRAALAGLVPERLDNSAYPLPGSNNGKGPARTGKPLNNQQVLDMVEAGLPPKVIVAKIERCLGAFDTSPDLLKELKHRGVHDSIILAMVQAS